MPVQNSRWGDRNPTLQNANSNNSRTRHAMNLSLRAHRLLSLWTNQPLSHAMIQAMLIRVMRDLQSESVWCQHTLLKNPSIYRLFLSPRKLMSS